MAGVRERSPDPRHLADLPPAERITTNGNRVVDMFTATEQYDPRTGQPTQWYLAKHHSFVHRLMLAPPAHFRVNGFVHRVELRPLGNWIG